MPPSPKLSPEAVIDLTLGLCTLLVSIAALITAFMTFKQGRLGTARTFSATAYYRLNDLDELSDH